MKVPDKEVVPFYRNFYEFRVNHVDIRDIAQDRWGAKQIANNRVLFKMPSSAAWWLFNPKGYYDQQTIDGVHCDKTEKEHEVARNAILDDESRMTMRIILEFPPEVVLTLSFCAGDGDYKLPFEYTSWEETFQTSLGQHKRMRDVMVWKIGIKEDQPRKILRESSTSGEAYLRRKFAGMSTS